MEENQPLGAIKPHFRATVWTGFCCLCLWCACGSDRDALIMDYVSERVSDFERKEWKKCRDGLLEQASGIVDSMLLEEVTTDALDSLRSRKPWRPVVPPPIEPLDSGGVRPIFDSLGDR